MLGPRAVHQALHLGPDHLQFVLGFGEVLFQILPVRVAGGQFAIPPDHFIGCRQDKGQEPATARWAGRVARYQVPSWRGFDRW